ncbi:hypothetical protein ScPMuIL_010674 [Solemya velum]
MDTGPKKVRINSDAVPTIHSTATTHSTASVKEADHLDQPRPGPSTPVTPVASQRLRPLMMLSPSEDVTSQCSPPKKIRRGYAKRETARANIQDSKQKPALKNAFQNVKPTDFEPEVNSKSVQREVTQSPFSSPLKMADNADDSDYEPSSEDESVDQTGNNDNQRSVPPEADKKFIVFQSNLLELFETCNKCGRRTSGAISYTNGSLVKIIQNCNHCLYEKQWYSQPFIGGKAAGNVLVSAAILFSGSTPSKILRFLDFLKIPSISMSTFMNHQRYCLAPVISHVWDNFQQDYLNDVTSSGRSVILGGDGRCDTPGHCAKYGSYNMIDLDESFVIDIQLVQSNEVPNSHHMEKEGLVRSVTFLKEHDIKIKALVTDGHKMIAKWVRENMPETTHNLDVWHVSKGIKKKLLKLSVEKDCTDLQPWIRSLTNHLYWTAATSQGLENGVIMARWGSVLNHIINIHTGHSAVFVSCVHGELEGRERRKKWLKPDFVWRLYILMKIASVTKPQHRMEP